MLVVERVRVTGAFQNHSLTQLLRKIFLIFFFLSELIPCYITLCCRCAVTKTHPVLKNSCRSSWIKVSALVCLSDLSHVLSFDLGPAPHTPSHTAPYPPVGFL